MDNPPDPYSYPENALPSVVCSFCGSSGCRIQKFYIVCLKCRRRQIRPGVKIVRERELRWFNRILERDDAPYSPTPN